MGYAGAIVCEKLYTVIENYNREKLSRPGIMESGESLAIVLAN